MDDTALGAVDTERLDLDDRRAARPQRVAASGDGMVSTAHYLATNAGVEMLEDGGNAVDAAVAAAFALSVCEPAASGIGGQSMMLLYDAARREKIALDGSSRAPHRTPPGGLKLEERTRGHTASSVPSTPAVLGYALNRYGTLPLARVLEPAIRLAEEGYPITKLQHDLTKREIRHLRAGTAAPLLLKEGRRLPSIGSRFRQPALAHTLRRLAVAGIVDFYQGPLARGIARDMEANGGLIREDDLAQIPWPVERRPLATWFHQHRVFTLGPPGAGRALIHLLNVLGHFSGDQRNPDTPEGALILAEAIRRAQLDRRDRPFDPHLYHQVPVKRMLSRAYARHVAGVIRERAASSHGETTHLSVMDRTGSVVSLTQSIERVFGSFAASPELGFLYNNYMSAFEYEDIAHPHYLRPNAVPWASVAPTLVFKGRHPWAALGSPGSERIVSAIAQVLVRLEDMSPFNAVDAPRLHCSTDGVVSLEASRMRDDVLSRLREHGFEIDVRDPYSFYLGCVQLVIRDRKEFIGVADPRRDGSAKGPWA
jgi:gamma-glutamyltranspeptidase/glutathione hydrolase